MRLFLLGAIATSHSYSGRENGTIFLNCTGGEESVFDCTVGFQRNCNHAERVSVTCQGQLQTEMFNVGYFKSTAMLVPYTYGLMACLWYVYVSATAEPLSDCKCREK